MKKMLLISLVLAVALITVPAFAGPFGGFSFSKFTVSANSGASVSSVSYNNSGSGAAAGNTSYAGVGFSGKDVTTLATTIGTTSGYGYNTASQFGNAYATGTKSGFGFSF